ncbi:MAG: hypothetical protein ACYS8W_05635 [Planctomycetota bacterium]
MYFVLPDHLLRIELLFVHYSFHRIFFDEVSHVTVTRKNTWLEAGCCLFAALIFFVISVASLTAGPPVGTVFFLIFLVLMSILGTFGILMVVRGELLIQVCARNYRLEMRLRGSDSKKRRFLNKLLRSIDFYQQGHMQKKEVE